MKFTRLRLLGFKSFVEPTEFFIEPGLTGIVGPNGCGKSNLVEALRWVMGESSYKNMRASGMDDVIFSGSLNRPARNTAEVTLQIDNADRKAPVTFKDADWLEVTRRIEREAGSAYKINGRDVRARDVQLLFADASSGAHSSAMVGQGKVGEFIAAKPQVRRALLEEAAGISGLHNRRHEAELRLRAAEQNLERLDDVIAEIQSQHDVLKRQARQAVRYRNLTGHIRAAEATVLHLRWLAANAALAEAGAALTEATRQVGLRTEEQAVTARVQAEAANALPDLRDTAARAAAALQRITVAREALDAEEQRVRERVAEIDRRLAQFADDIAREERMLTDYSAIAARLDEEEKGLETAIASISERQVSATARRQSTESTLAESEKAFAECTEELARIMASRGQFERTITEVDERSARLRQQAAAVDTENAELDAATASLPLVADRQAAVNACEAALRTAEEANALAEKRAANARDDQAAKREALAEAERALGRKEAEESALASLLSTPAAGIEPIIDAIDVAPGYEAALIAAFGDDLDAPVDEVAPVHWRTIADFGIDPLLPFGVRALAERVKGPAAIARRLQQVGIIRRERGPELQRQLRPGQRLVSREGDLWRWDGFTSTAEGGAAASAQRLESRNRLAALESEFPVARALVAQRQQELATSTAALTSANEEENRTRTTWRDAQRSLDQARVSMAEAERENGRVAARRSAIEEARNRLATSLAEAEGAATAARDGFAATPDPAQFSDRIAALRQKVDEDRTVLAEARAAVESLAREEEHRSGRLAAIAVERKTWDERAANAEAQIATLSTRRTEAEQECQRLAGEPGKIEAQRVSLFRAIETAEKARATATDRLAEGETALAAADKAAREALDRLAEAREKRGRAEEREVAAQERRGEVSARIAEVLDCEPEGAIEQAELKPDAPLPDLGDTEARLERYKQERERLGAVNLRAEAEAVDLSGRRDALARERDDLVAAIQRLRHGISSLNREGRERLTAAFDTVNDHFKKLFTHLFGGGEAELHLIDSDDPLEAGLEIVARPPGKKPQIMTLLSGGEQALTAMALIFAVFLTNPAPICVLDEVDAPLDDANIERFCNLLDEMTRQTDTRFVVITHNPITMARMSRLFGVTMAERGVSQMVSVDLETAESFLEAV